MLALELACDRVTLLHLRRRDPCNEQGNYHEKKLVAYRLN